MTVRSDSSRLVFPPVPYIGSKKAQFTDARLQLHWIPPSEKVVMCGPGLDSVHQDVGGSLCAVLQAPQHTADLVTMNVVPCETCKVIGVQVEIKTEV